MELKPLRYFIAIAEEGSMSAAARRLGIAQPSLSQHVKQLEEECAAELMTRSPRGVVPTDAGSLLLERARALVLAADEMREEVRAVGTEPRGAVSFGLPSSVSMVLSVPLAETVQQELPQVRLRAVEAMSGYIRQWLQEGEVDLGILYNVEELGSMSVRRLLSEELFFYAAPDCWPFSGTPGEAVSLAQVAKVDLVLPSRSHGLRTLIDQAAAASGIGLNVALEMDALAQIKALVGRGSGFTILAPAAAQDRAARGELISAPIVDPAIRRPVYLVDNPQMPKTRACREVERLTLTVIADLVRRGIWLGEAEPDLAP